MKIVLMAIKITIKSHTREPDQMYEIFTKQLKFQGKQTLCKVEPNPSRIFTTKVQTAFMLRRR
jgi:hypothetical protein